MLLKDLLNKIEIKKVTGDTNIDIKNIQYYSPFVTKGSLFICIEGFKTDGQLYIRDAIDRGAVAIISEKETVADGITVILVENARRTMSQVASCFYSLRGIKTGRCYGTNGRLLLHIWSKIF